MRFLVATAVVWTFAAAAAGQAPATKYWAYREIGFPVPPDALKGDPRPQKIRLYSAPDRGDFKLAVERDVDKLDPIDGRPPGFKYAAKADGEEDFAVQLVAANGDLTPATDKLRAETRIVFDTRPPAVQLQASGTTGVEWAVTDDNLDPAGVKLECRWVGEQRWFEVESRTDFRARDSYTWSKLRNPLEVRVIGKDKAGNDSVSRIVRLPDADGRGGNNLARNFPEPSGDLRTGDFRPRGDLGDAPGQPQIVYVNDKVLTIHAKLTRVTRSGVKAVQLFVKKAGDGEWKGQPVQTCDIPFEKADPHVDILYTAPGDGRYGFIVIPTSGADLKDSPPGPNATPQHLVEVDTIAPKVTVTSCPVSPGKDGPRVEINWTATDENMHKDGILIEYAADRAAKNWASIQEKYPNSGRHVWEVPREVPFKVFIRVRAVDKAGNSAEHIYDKPVVIDLDKPTAVIDHARAAAAAAPTTTEKPGK